MVSVFAVLQVILGAALVTPPTLGIISATFTDPRQRTAAVGTWSAVGALALASGIGFTPTSQGGTHIVERNLTRLTAAVGVLFGVNTVVLYRLLA